MRASIACAVITAVLAAPLRAATTITISSTVVTPSVKRLGLNTGWMNYFDSGQILKNLVARNPGFEGQISRSIIRCVTGTATSFVDENTNAQWPAGFWSGASYEVITGAARGRTGTITTSAPPAGSAGTTFQLADSGTAPASGDFIVLRKINNAADPTFGWRPNVANGGTITSETADLASDTVGHQAIRMTAATGQTARISAVFDTSSAGPFIQLNGPFRISFKAKAAAAPSSVNVSVTRNAPANLTFVNQTIPLTSNWSAYNIDFNANESGTSIGTVELRFTAIAPATLLLDDVTMQQTTGDATNTTAFRDPVVNAIRDFNPGILRYWVENLAGSLDNDIAPAPGRMRAEYSPQDLTRDDVMYGLQEFLELCDLVHAEPWYIVPTTYSATEMSNLIEYLSGPTSSPYGAKRAARGRSAPWTSAFAKIHLEFGNEAWNMLNYYGATLPDAVAYGNRGSTLFGAARSTPYFIAGQFDLVLSGQAALPARNISIHNASTNHDTIAVAPYFGGYTDSFNTDEELFGPLFAEPEMLSQTGYMRANFNNIRTSSRPVPLAIYEVNLHTTEASACPQARLDAFAPSAGAGLAVADHMLMMLRDLGIKDQALHSLTSIAAARTDGKYVLLWGAVRDMGVTNRKRPQFLAVKLANEAIAGDLVQAAQSGDNPAWNQPLVNRIQYDTAHYIQTYAFAGGGKSAVIVFNLHRTDALQVNFAGVNAPHGAVTIRRLTSSAITNTNESSENVAISTQSVTNFDPAQTMTLPPFSMTVIATVPAARRRATLH